MGTILLCKSLAAANNECIVRHENMSDRNISRAVKLTSASTTGKSSFVWRTFSLALKRQIVFRASKNGPDFNYSFEDGCRISCRKNET
jgi:hypothetical protein